MTSLVAVGIATALSVPAAPLQAPRADPQPEPSGFHRFLADVGHDYVNYFSVENAQWALVGGTVAGVMHGADHVIADAAAAPTPTALKPGATYGNLAFQFPLAAGWWVIGHATGSAKAADAGRDLVRAQISAVSWTYAIKYAVNRTRPNGDPRSFPSGHTTATFASAMVLQRHYGWKLGLPFFAMGAYTACERVTENKHWASDVTFGAVIGLLSGRTVTLHLGKSTATVQPQAIPGGAGVSIHVVP